MNPILRRRGAVVVPTFFGRPIVARYLARGRQRHRSLNRGGRYTACGVAAHERHWEDGFWLMHTPDQAKQSVEACVAADNGVTCNVYGELTSIPGRGPLAANNVTGAVSGWGAAYSFIQAHWGGQWQFSRLL
jgi:gamma-glutamyltranspeptidase/glutathione hydrolase